MKNIEISDIEVLWDKKQINTELVRITKEINQNFINYESVNLIPILTGGIIFVSRLIEN